MPIFSVELIETCVLNLDLSYADSALRMDFDLGTIEPAGMGVWILSLFGVGEVWSSPIPVVDPIISFPAPLPLPSIGNIGITYCTLHPGKRSHLF